VRIRYLKQDVDRHGKPRLYVRLPGKPMIRLTVSSTDDPGFGPAYAAALSGESVALLKPQGKGVKAAPGSLRELCARYLGFLSKDTTLAEKTKYARRLILDEVCRETAKSGAVAGDMPVSKMTSVTIQQLLDRKQETPDAANNRRKTLLALFRWAIPRGLATENPVEKTQKIAVHSEGHAAWSQEHVTRFVETHPLGTRPYLALALLLYSGQRVGDVIRFGRQHVKDGKLQFVQQKNERRTHKAMRIPILPALQEALDTVPPTQLTFLQNAAGRPFSQIVFSAWFRRQCDLAGLQGYSAHGLRKTMQTVAAEAGFSDRELMDWAGHTSPKMTSLYTRGRDQERIAEAGMRKLAGARFGNRIGSPEARPDKSEPDRSEK
jgi:integrase